MQEQIKNINTLEELQALYASVFGKNGTMTARLKQMKDLKMRYETGYDSDIEAENEMLAMSRDVKEKLNSHSLLEKFLTKSK